MQKLSLWFLKSTKNTTPRQKHTEHSMKRPGESGSGDCGKPQRVIPTKRSRSPHNLWFRVSMLNSSLKWSPIRQRQLAATSCEHGKLATWKVQHITSPHRSFHNVSSCKLTTASASGHVPFLAGNAGCLRKLGLTAKHQNRLQASRWIERPQPLDLHLTTLQDVH